MPAQILAALLLIPACAGIGHWFALHGRDTVAFKVLKLLHTAYGLVLGLTLLALSISTSSQANFEYWVQLFLTNMFVLLYLWTAAPFIAGFAWGARKSNPSGRLAQPQ